MGCVADAVPPLAAESSDRQSVITSGVWGDSASSRSNAQSSAAAAVRSQAGGVAVA